MMHLPHNATSRRTAQQGVSLVELAIVLLVIGLLLGGVMMSLSTQDEIKRGTRTEQRLAEVRDAVAGFAVVNARLPRPAVSALNGAERGACATELQCTGFLPWAALGLDRLDGHDKLLRYSVTPAYANAPFTLASVPTKAVTSRDAAGAVNYLAGAAGCPANSGCVPMVVFSHGRANHGTTQDGTALPDASGTNADEDANAAASVSFMARDFTANPAAAGGEFDDRVAWLGTSMLFGRMVQAGKLP